MPRSDIYALGVILYELVTGRVPYKAETPVAVIFKHIQDPLPSARELNPELPEAVELVILKALSKNPEDRYQTADDMVRAIQAAIPDASSVNCREHRLSDIPKRKIASRQKAMPRWTWAVIGFAVIGFVFLSAIVGGLFAVFNRNNQPSDSDAIVLTATRRILQTVRSYIRPAAVEILVHSRPMRRCDLGWGKAEIYIRTDRPMPGHTAKAGRFHVVQPQLRSGLGL